jgi:hypothetical protein
MNAIWKVGDGVLSPEGIPGVVVAVDAAFITVNFSGSLGRYPHGAGLRPSVPGPRPPNHEEKEE